MRLLIIGDLEGQIGTASHIARDRGATVNQVPDINAALESLREGRGADMIMMDVKEPIGELVINLKAERFAIPVIACGTQSDSQAAVAAIKAGAKEYIPLPPQPELIAAVMEAITEKDHSVIYRSERTEKVLQLAKQVAPSNASILITGESGTGKEVIARFIQSKSDRQNKPFISVNCAAIPENLLESELFGHEKGAFTGAVARRIGKFEEANQGTLLLDEISEMELRLQAKLLRAIQEKEIDRVGGSKPVKVDIRILATSNRNLLESVKKGEFREDLYFRLNVINIEMPPLRERVDDILPLAEHFIGKYCEANRFGLKTLDKHAEQKLLAYHWPGNVRELENTMHRAVLMATGQQIDEEAVFLSANMAADNRPQSSALSDRAITAEVDGQQQGAESPNNNEEDMMEKELRKRNELVGRTVASVEKELILDTLDYCLGNRTHAANILGISIRTLRNKLKQYNEYEDEDNSTAGVAAYVGSEAR
jgi:DNA-binding NtrC family response regulator